MKIKDYFLSQKIFEIEKTNDEGVLKLKNIPHDLNKYYESNEYLSHTKNDSLKSKIYKKIQVLNDKYKLKKIHKYKKSGTILDYGCGDGSFLKFMQKNNFEILGYEPNNKALKIAKEKIGDENIINSVSNIENNSLDIISLWHVLEHIPNPEEVLFLLKEKIKDDGFIIIALPNHDSFDAKYYKEYWAAWDLPRHVFHYSKKGAINLFTKNNLKIVNTYPLPFDSFYISMLSETYKKNKLGILRFPFIGFYSNLLGIKTKNYSSIMYILKK